MSRRILVVDDEPHVTRLVKQRLSSEGYEVVTAPNGLKALQILETDGPFDVVITDYNMPKMDGRQLTESIRERYADSRMSVFLVTARLEQPLRQWAEGQPTVSYIEKPVSLQDLCERLAKCFARHEGDSPDPDEVDE